MLESILHALHGHALPAVFVDLDGVDDNLDAAIAYAGATPLRLATKSVRVPAVIEQGLARPDVVGLMCAAPHEAAWWGRRRPGVDVLIAYPSVERDALRDCAELVADGGTMRFMVDCGDHLDLLQAIAAEVGTTLEVCLDLDLSVDVGGSRGLRFGVHRSPLRSTAAVMALASEVLRRPNLRLVALMGYEAQIAGLQDRPVGGGVKAALVRRLKRSTAAEVTARRAEAVAALRAMGVDLMLVNGGGSGSIPYTAAESVVTEIAVGSALLAPALFDGYDDVRYRPAAGFALRVTRIPEPGVVTCYGGGWVASGAAGADRLPTPWFPEGARLLVNEGAGEVQTPVRLPPDVHLAVGDVVLMRHAKAGELADRTDELLCLRDGAVVHAAPSYRALGLVLS